MDVDDVREVQLPNGNIERSALVGGCELYFRVPAGHQGGSHIGDSFAAAALVPSMKEGTPLRLRNTPISEKLADNLQALQQVYHCWNPRLRIVEVQAERAASRYPPHDGTGSMFSGGVDSMFTFLQHEEEITDLILISGFDFLLAPGELDESQRRNRDFADAVGKRLVPVETNFLEFERKMGLAHDLAHGICLVSVILNLGLRRVLIPSSHTYAELAPWGSHPLTDPMWSNGTTEIVHANGEARRSRKIQALATHPTLLESLRVCWTQPNDNCGQCSKCIRTMLTLRVLGIQGPFPPLQDLSAVRTLRPYDELGLGYFIDNLMLAAEHGDKEVVRALKAVMRRWDRRWALLHFDRGFMNNLGRRILRKLRPPREGPTGFAYMRPDLDV